MESSSSIVSFNNDSTLNATAVKADTNTINVHELALHAMRDRCLLLQRRINALESDNMRLKLDMTKAEASQYILQDDDAVKLHQKIAELTKQKSQLMHHVFMVSCENKNLWSKISALKLPDKVTKQQLLRTNTYIQSTPKSSANYQEKFSESSLEEISLKLINSYIQEKSQLVEQYEQMARLQDSDDVLNVDSIGFPFIEDPATDSLKEIHNYIEKLQQLKKDLTQQEKDLEYVVTKIELALEDGFKCASCAANNTVVTSSEHKEIETSDSLANWATPVESSTYNYNEQNVPLPKKDSPKEINNEIIDKVCPMCGETFQSAILFTEFQAHVEGHFTGDIEPDSIVDNFVNIPSSFDNVI